VNISDILAGYYSFWHARDISDIRVRRVTGILEILLVIVVSLRLL